jgi:hypothetical protein
MVFLLFCRNYSVLSQHYDLCFNGKVINSFIQNRKLKFFSFVPIANSLVLV